MLRWDSRPVGLIFIIKPLEITSSARSVIKEKLKIESELQPLLNWWWMYVLYLFNLTMVIHSIEVKKKKSRWLNNVEYLWLLMAWISKASCSYYFAVMSSDKFLTLQGESRPWWMSCSRQLACARNIEKLKLEYPNRRLFKIITPLYFIMKSITYNRQPTYAFYSKIFFNFIHQKHGTNNDHWNSRLHLWQL